MKNIFVLFFIAYALVACSGLGTSKSPVIAKLNTDAENGNADSQYLLGLRFTNGSGVNQNYKRAADWLKRASEQGHHKAEFLLGVAYSTGRGIGQNKKEAVKLFSLAASAGHARAQYQLAEAFANALGTQKDILWAARWYEKAARQKHVEALFSLGVMRASGIDGKADPEQAWVWLQLASQNGHELAAKVRDQVKDKLSRTSLLKAKAIADNWQWPTARAFDDAPTVRYVQRGLNKLGLKAGKDDAIAGSNTNAAIRDFRESRKVGSSTEIDLALVNALRAALSGIK